MFSASKKPSQPAAKLELFHVQTGRVVDRAKISITWEVFAKSNESWNRGPENKRYKSYISQYLFQDLSFLCIHVGFLHAHI